MTFLLQTLLSPGLNNQVIVDESVIIDFVFKLLFMLSVLFYIVFAVIVIRQVQIMKNTLITPVSPFLMLLSILHLIAALLILGLFFVIL